MYRTWKPEFAEALPPWTSRLPAWDIIGETVYLLDGDETAIHLWDGSCPPPWVEHPYYPRLALRARIGGEQ